MDESEARTRIESMVSASSDPPLDASEIDRLVADARRADAEGHPPDDPEWVPTWDLNSAAAAGWLLKAGKAAERFTFSSGGQRFERAQIVDHCRRMAREYRRRLVAGVP